MAFTVVFAHSVIPHVHHCTEAGESHIHHFSNCEQLGTYICEDHCSESPVPDFHIFLPAIYYSADIAETDIDTGTHLFPYPPDTPLPDSPAITRVSLRGPPAA